MMRYKPMLAHKFDKKKVDWKSRTTFMQPKLDGVRCLIQYYKDKKAVTAYSRTGKPWLNIDHILQDLEPMFKGLPDVVLDGELYNHELKNDFEKIISLVRKKKPKPEDREESKQLVQFHCYDVIEGDPAHELSARFDARNTFLNIIVKPSQCVRIVETINLYQSQSSWQIHVEYGNPRALALHKKWLKQGYEGSILRLNGVYEQKRSHSLQKFKDFHDTEAEIVGWVEGKGKRVGTIGKFLARDSEGVEFGMPVMENFNYLQSNFKEMQSWIGKTATFTYFERTKANSYRHPLFKCIRDYE
jgi:DNA ligase-1